MKTKIVASPLPNIPWQDRAAGNADLLWRYSENPVIGRRPLPHVTGIYNSAVVPFKGKFIGVFRTEGMDRMPHLHVGRSRTASSGPLSPRPSISSATIPRSGGTSTPMTRASPWSTESTT
jgi:beta-1,4-mannooligosaccharide/beta-1,4-mannosyl-N-acetylglucosamine phosphorylase